MIARASSLALLALLLLCACSEARAKSGVGLRLEAPFARVLASGVGVIYVRLINDGALPDRLERVDALGVADAQLHEVIMEGELSTMRSAPGGFVIPAGASLALTHGGKHIMLFGVTDAPTRTTLRATFHFEHSAARTLDIPVQHGF